MKNIAYGIHTVETIIRKKIENVIEVWVQKGIQNSKISKLLPILTKHDIQIHHVEKKTLNKISNDNHQGIIVTLKEVKTSSINDISEFLDNLDKNAFILILDGITDPHNLGACLRTAAAAGVQLVISSKHNASPLNSIARKVASGAAEQIPFLLVNNLVNTIEILKEKGVWIYAADTDGEKSIYNVDLTGNIAFIMGSEGKGIKRLAREKSDYLINIPMLHEMKSLNVSVATGVCLFEALRQRTIK